MKISEVMTPAPACCTYSDDAQKAAMIMQELSVGIVPVIADEESGRLVGVVTDRDLCMAVVAAGENPKDVSLDSVMSTDIVTCHPNDDVETVLGLMRDNQVRRVPVVDDDDRIQGIVSTADMVLCGELNHAEVDEALQDISEPTLEEFRHLTELVNFEGPDGDRLNQRKGIEPRSDASSKDAS